MALRNSNQNYTGLIPKYIGTAYDKVARVADSIDEVDAIGSVIEDGTWQDVVDHLDDITEVVQKINDFNDIYYGIYEEHPTESPSGGAIDAGDMYYNSVEQHLYVYNIIYDPITGDIVKAEWLPVGTVETTTELVIITQDNLDRGGIVDLNFPYVPGQNNLFVYVNNICQYSTNTDGSKGSYTELNGGQIQFLDNRVHDGDGGHRSLVVDDEIYLVIGVNVANVEHNIDVHMARYVTQVPNEQIITLPPTTEEPDGMTYVQGDHNLEVYLKTNQHSREIQVVGLEYLETNPQQITFITPLPQYSEIVFKKGVILSNLPMIPRVLFMENKPTEIFYDQGQFWFNTSTGRLFILYMDNDSLQWVDISEENTIITPDYEPKPEPPVVTVNATVFQPLQPEPSLFAEGTLWFNTATGELSILYTDKGDAGHGVSAQWVKVSTQ